ncbi:MAG: hypothetical protein M3140_06195, partial [Actinomycetota bacterium]|nr:hypothetical protein [Actinomycetota bacterium]
MASPAAPSPRTASRGTCSGCATAPGRIDRGVWSARPPGRYTEDPPGDDLPIYGYRCQSCQHEFETQQPMSDPPHADCPDCGGPGTRLFYPTGILFKGSGFYKTDSRSTPAAAAPATTDGAKPEAGASKPESGAGA